MKRFIALVLSLVMALSLCAPAWGATTTVSTAAELATALAKNEDVTLANDIVLSEWTPIGTSSVPYSGTFDGNGKTISGLKITSGDFAGLFGYVSGATIKNVTLADVSVSGGKRMGALVGQINGDAVVENCTVSGSVTGADSNTGGIIGEIIKGTVLCKNLVNNAAVTNTKSDNSRAGGIVGQVTTNANVTMTDCVNNGAVTTDNGFAGGIVSAYQSGTLKINNCVNNGTLTGAYKGNMLGWYTSVRGMTISSETSEFDVNAIGCIDIELSSNMSLYGREFFVNKKADLTGVSDTKQTFSTIFAENQIGTAPVALWDKLIAFYAHAAETNSHFEGYPDTYWKMFNQSAGYSDPDWNTYFDSYNAQCGAGNELQKSDFSSASWRKVIVYEVVPVAQVGDVEYTTLAKAVAAANDGDTIELLQSVQAPGVRIDSSKYPTKGLTIDLNGFTYDVVAPTVGSSGTETNAFQLLKGGKITFKEGTITSSVAKILIQNYSDLTLLNVNVDGTKLQAPKYALSNNNGDVLITGNTSITAAADGVAFDVCRFASYAGPSVTVDTNGTITGKVEVTTTTGNNAPAETNTSKLEIKKGNFVGVITKDTASGDKATVSITGGTFSADPKAYVADGYAAFKDGEKYTVKAVVAKIGDVNYDTLQAAVTAVKNGETINVVVAGQTATVNEAKSFTVTGKAATITAAKGYKVLQDGNTYTVKKTYNVTFDANGGTNEYTLAPVVEGKLVLPANPFKAPVGKQFKAWSVDGKEYAVGAEIDVAADVTVVAVWTYLPAVTENPEVDVIGPAVSTGDKVDTNNATVNSVVTTITSGVDIDHGAITEAAEEAAEENKVVPTKEQAKELNKLPGISGTTVKDVAIVVQTYYDVAIEEVNVDKNTAKPTSITVNITPMQQTVATTDTVIENKDDIKVGTNAVKVGDPVPVKITEPVEITLKLPSSCFEVGQKVYITHKASDGNVIYEATVAADYTITFKTTHGFSPFTISTTAADVKASVGTDNYADLQSAVNYMGKNATVIVKAPDQKAVVGFATTFTVEYKGGATKDNTKITAAPGYYLTTKDVTGGVQYTVSRAYGWGGGSSSTTPDKVVTSAKTFDAGIALYVGMSVMAAAGSAVVLKKRED